MMNPQGQQQMYMQPQQTSMGGMPQQQPSQLSYAMQVPQPSSSSSMMNVKQEPQISLSNVQSRIPTQNFSMQQQQQQIKQELMQPPIQQQQQQLGLQVQQMRSQQQQQQQPMPLPSQQYIQHQQTPVLAPQSTATASQQRTLAQVILGTIFK